ncbi:MAG: dihydrofolate reductase family protein [Kibdelosporangium sp.]
MRKLVYYVALSLDGRIAGPAGEIDFYPMSDEYSAWMTERYPETIPTQFRPMAGVADAPNKSFDTVLMGWNTYQPALDENITSPYAHMRQYVVGGVSRQIADPSVTLVTGDPVDLVRELKQEDGLDIWLCGGGLLAGSLLAEIDELVIKSYPVVAVAGVPAFTGEFQPTYFEPAQRQAFGNGNVVTWLTRKKC